QAWRRPAHDPATRTRAAAARARTSYRCRPDPGGGAAAGGAGLGQSHRPPRPARQALERAAALAGQAAEQVRSVSQRLHPPEWQRLKMAEALEQLWTAG